MVFYFHLHAQAPFLLIKVENHEEIQRKPKVFLTSSTLFKNLDLFLEAAESAGVGEEDFSALSRFAAGAKGKSEDRSPEISITDDQLRAMAFVDFNEATRK
jgi:hypothetical protein